MKKGISKRTHIIFSLNYEAKLWAHQNITIQSPANVKRSDTDGISCNYEAVVSGVQKNKWKDAIQHVHKVFSMFLILINLTSNTGIKLEVSWFTATFNLNKT